MSRIKKTLSLFLLLFLFECGGVQHKSAQRSEIDLPWIAFKLITEGRNDPCVICEQRKMNEAISILVRKYPDFKRISSNESCVFTRIAECGKGEFVHSCYMERESFVMPDGSVRLFPMLIFRFHTEKDHLVGIAAHDYTNSELADKINSLPPASLFFGELSVINFKYGDGPTFIYLKDKNQLVVHCTVLRIDSSGLGN